MLHVLRSTTLACLVAFAVLATGCEQAALLAPSEQAPDRMSAEGPVSFGKADAGGVIKDQYIITFKDDVGNAGEAARGLLARHGGTLGYTYEHALKGFSATLPAAAVEAIRQNPNVASVEPDQRMTIVATQTNATWGLDRIDAASGLDGSYTYDATGAGVTAYVIDTGIRLSHKDFGGRAVTGYDAIDGGSADDCNGHGTHVAGTVGGTTWGVAKGVALVAVRVLDCQGSGTTSGVIAGVDWVTANAQKPAVANMSLGGGASSTLDEAVSTSIASGVSYAVAAGNGDFLGRQADACNYSPARVPEAITIGATDSKDSKTSWSNYGDCVDFFAPGASITSAWIGSDDDTNTISGTSMAAPHAAGVAALYLETNLNATPQTVRDALYNATTKSIVTNSSTANNHLLYSLVSGGSGGGGTTDDPPTASFTYSCTDLACSFDAGGSTDDTGVSSYDWTFGDNTSGSGVTTNHTYAAGGSYTVTLTVTDGVGQTDTQSRTVTVSEATSGGITLSVSAYKVKGTQHADLSWSGASSTNVDVYVNGARYTTANDGFDTHSTGQKGGGSATYKVCEAGTTTCSAEKTVTW